MITAKKITAGLIVALICLLLFLSFFHRHPSIQVDLEELDPAAIYAPAYGTLKDIRAIDDYIHVIIFLSPLDIHRQYYPCDGTLTAREHDNSGKYYLAYELEKSSENDKVITTLDTAHGRIVIKQIAGFLARCIVSYDSVGDNIRAGREMGMIEFGSRVDLLLPRAGLELQAKIGQRLNGPDTVIGTYISDDTH
jgi:phosphatidylserine decarboxylase